MMTAAHPLEATRDDRKSAAIAAERLALGSDTRVIGGLEFARELLRSNLTRQAGAGAREEGAEADPAFTSVFYLDGEPHKRKRQAIVRFLTPKAIGTTSRVVMEQTSDAPLARIRTRGKARLDRMSFELAVTVASQIVGLTESDQAAMARRIQATLAEANFFLRDVQLAIIARRKERREDVISHLLDEEYPDKAILVECLTCSVAGMITTHEFIVMAAWHLFGNDAVRERFLVCGEAEQIAILEELIRLDPVVDLVARRAVTDAEPPSGCIAEGEKLIIDLRSANVDEAGVGECPYALHPNRARQRRGGARS